MPGVPLVQALELLVEQTEGGLRSIVIVLKDGIKEGRSLADGLSKFPETFDSIFIQLVKAGEATGKLESILERLTDFLERREEIRKKVTDALRYPMFQLIIVILVVIGLLTFVVPQIATVFQGQNIALPLPTRVLLAMSNFVLSHYILLTNDSGPHRRSILVLEIDSRRVAINLIHGSCDFLFLGILLKRVQSFNFVERLVCSSKEE